MSHAGVRPGEPAVGFVVKSGWASAVLLGRSGSSYQPMDSRVVALSDPEVPEARQPYHAGFGVARSAGGALDRLVRSVEHFGIRSVRALIGGYEARGLRPVGAGLVVGSTSDPARIRNEHVRIHALEGRLFRQVVEDALSAEGIPFTVWRRRDLGAAAAAVAGRPESELRAATAVWAKGVRPWRVEQKEAALAAWLALAAALSVGRAAGR